MKELPIPMHFDPKRVGEVWRVPYPERVAQASAWAAEHELTPSFDDATRVGLLLVDVQNTFCIPGHDLFVRGENGRGPVDDNIRLCEFIYRNLDVLTQIDPALDTHTMMQIFHPVFLVDDDGNHPEPFTSVSLEDVESGAWKVNPSVEPWVRATDKKTLQDHLLHYCTQLKEGGRHELMIWPYHSMLGGIGHALVSAVEEAIFFHNHARLARTAFELKGQHPLTEFYSVFSPEVLDATDGDPLSRRNQHFIDRLLSYDALIIAGQAKSHAVRWTVEDLLATIRERDAALAGKVYLLEDCTSPMVVPDQVDFTDDANAAFEGFAKAGVHIVRSTAPLRDWPDFPSERG